MSALEVARWMAQELLEKRTLYQEDAVWRIQNNFGKDFVYVNENGNLAISTAVLKEFKGLTGDTVVWERGERCWRYRAAYDPTGKRSVE